MRERIVVGMDGSAGARAALARALREASRREARVDVVSAYLPPLEPVAAGDAQPIASPVDLRNAVLTSARRIVDEVVAEAAPTTGPVPVDVDAVAGEAAHALIVRSRGAVMLVIGHHGRGGLEELPVGSVARRCVRDATCPVLVVPVGDGADLGPG